MGDTQAAPGNVLQTVLVQWIKKEKMTKTKKTKKTQHPTSYYSSLLNDEQFFWGMPSQ